ncbi:hypothetical protein [uncultured Microscilla sp.]|uniref:hypothetical protein n=1 Tax=uncultured Microscilla sp. TaxID=432653 RepID=UPI00260BC923|nr:hypothetical protein [uncultured Microscilla sp.]
MNKLLIALLAFSLLSTFSYTSLAQHQKIEASLKKEIKDYHKSFTQKVIFDISRYFKYRGKVLPEITRYFRGIKVTRRQTASQEPALYEFLYHNQTIKLPEPEVRKLVGLQTQLALNLHGAD